MKSSVDKLRLIKSCAEEIIHKISVEKKKIENRELLLLCQDLGDIFDGTTDSHLCHEIAEIALNLLIKRQYASELLSGDNQIEQLNQVLVAITKRLPTQTWRSRRQCAFQQFSTPPEIAFLLTYLLNLKPLEQVLEPSAGTGSLAIWASGSRANVITNETDPDRNSMLSLLGFEPTSLDAEFINDFLPPETEIDCVLMNPPFSSNGERTKNNSSKYGFRHVESALETLKKGGKFGIILGEAAGLDTKTGRDFWQRLAYQIEVKTIIKLNGREYYKNGTTVDINLIVGKKLVEVPKLDWNKRMKQILCLRAESVEAAFNHAQRLNLRLNQ